MKDKRRRRSKIFNTEELLHFRNSSTPLLEVEEARCPDSNIGQQGSLGITPVTIREEVTNPCSEKVGNVDEKAWSSSTPLQEIPPEVYSTPVAPLRLSDSLPYSPSQSLVADISQSPLANSFVSPNSPASDMEFFTPFSQIKSRSSKKKTGGKLQPKQLSSKYPEQATELNGDRNRSRETSASFMKVNKTSGENLTLLKNCNAIEDKLKTCVTNNNVNNFESIVKDNNNCEISKTKVHAILKIIESPHIDSNSVIKGKADESQEEGESVEKSMEENRWIEDSVSRNTGEAEELGCKSPNFNCQNLMEKSTLIADSENNTLYNSENQSIQSGHVVIRKTVSNKAGASKRGRPRKVSTDQLQALQSTTQIVSESTGGELESTQIKGSFDSIKETDITDCPKGMEQFEKVEDYGFESQSQKNNLNNLPCKESEVGMAEEESSTKGKKKRGRPRKNSVEVYSSIVPCSSLLLTDDAAQMKDDFTDCRDILEEEAQVVEERKSRRLRRRSFEIYRCSEEESKGQSNDGEEQQDGKGFGTILKDVNGKAVPVKASRKKKTESEDDINKIYTVKNYVPPPVKALETISESPTLAKQARKLKRLIEFGSLYHIPPIKQKKRQQKAVKRGWDPRKFRKSKIPDDVAQLKLQSVWEDLDKD